jgi:hypothetical protein
MKSLACLSVLVAITLGLSSWLGSQGASAAHISTQADRPPVERSSRLLLSGRVRCAAAVPSVVQVGQALDVKIGLHNVSKRPVTISPWVFSGSLVLKAADGTTYDSSGPLQGLTIPPPIPRKLRAGRWMGLGPIAIPVRWPGPLRVTIGCLGKGFPTFRVDVATPGPPPDESAAVTQVVAASGHLLDQCGPQTPGVAVTGTIEPPSGNAPPMDAQCSISFTSEGQFLVAQELVLAPPGLSGVQIYQPYETLWPTGSFVGLAASPPYAAIAWEFVVTGARATPVAAATLATSCGGGTSFAAGGTRPDLDFLSVCS